MAINLFNIDRNRFITCAPVKNQCSRDNFYGQDPALERALQNSEGSYARALAEMLQPAYLLNDSHRLLLRRFWLLQHLRTEAASRRAVEMSAGMETSIGSKVEGFRPTIREAVITAMHTFVDTMDLIDDLKVCLIRNRTSVPFITSDDPAIITNRWYMEDRRPIGRSFGLASAGALMLLPLTPRVLCLVYDGDVYSVSHNGGWVEARHERDIKALNEHQFLNCRANIFFREWHHSQGIHDDFKAVEFLRPAEHHRIHYAIFDHADDDGESFRVVDRAAAGDHERAMIHVENIFAKPSTWARQITWRARGSVYTNGTGVGYVRRDAIPRVGGSDFRKVQARLNAR